MTTPRTHRTPIGTWPVVVAGLLLLALAPFAVALPALPWPAQVVIVLVFGLGGLWALATSVVLLWRTWHTPAIGPPIIGCVLGFIVVPIVLLVMVPVPF